eukprot:CAMPEP_0114246110 /NCGR_PEP_ID=MMETSP0058-20121206/12271_1 /TAXON_ID=36894 /ORGANISM="Pyramimonas parkeae, CCMP726" /LENGTH=268 /DNA_ID=CAMNT_0001359241 /DNA_START=501 /DNA_END=1307 /DNA_ORIENTATION=+
MVTDTSSEEFYNKNTILPAKQQDVSMGSMPYHEWREGDKANGSFGFCQLGGNAFKVRGKNYLKDKKKQPAGEPALRLLTMDWFKTEQRCSHVAGRKQGVCAQLLQRPDVAFVLAVAIQFPSHSHYTMVSYYGASAPIDKESLIGRFIYGDDKFRNERLKLIPRVMEGAWVVQRAVGTVPVLLGKAVKVEYHSGANYMEMDVNIGSSATAHTALKCVFGYAANLVIDFGWVVEGRAEAELPEVLLGTMRIAYLDETQAVEPPPEEYDDA